MGNIEKNFERDMILANLNSAIKITQNMIGREKMTRDEMLTEIKDALHLDELERLYDIVDEALLKNGIRKHE